MKITNTNITISIHGNKGTYLELTLNMLTPLCSTPFYVHPTRGLRSRIRCMEHLERGAAACTEALRSGRIPQLSPEAVAAAADADAAERRASQAEGRDPRCGPPTRPRVFPQQSRDPPEILDDDP